MRLSFLFQVVFCFHLFHAVRGGTVVCDTKSFSEIGLELSSFPFCDSTLSYQVRAKDLVDRLSLEEKIGQIGDESIGVKRLNIPPYNWWSEALHGVSDVGHGTHFDDITPAATSFPTVILSAAAFNVTLWTAIAVAISDEARALHNVGLSGLTFWSPNINVVRDPRWGRIVETPGEDPFVVGRYAVSYVRGMQDIQGYEGTPVSDPNSRPLKVAACCKHFAAYDVDNWNGVDRYHFDAKVTERDMLETFLYPFEMCVKEGDVASVMCSYNRVNGIPSCADPKLLNQTIRGLWDLHGYIVADCDSIEVMISSQHYLNFTAAEDVAQALKAGLDLDCGGSYSQFAMEAVKTGKVREGEIDKSLRNLYVTLMRLGWFDGSPGNYSALGRSDVCTPRNLGLATDAARQGIVLLKNDNNTLPLNDNAYNSTFAVVGPHANATLAMIGNYALKTPCRYSTPLGAIRMYGNVKYAPGCFDVKCTDDSSIPAAVEAASGVDATIVFLGLDLSVEAESLDRVDLRLPGNQEMLLTNLILTASSNGPIVVVILSAGGIDISAMMNNPKISAILWAGYPGAEGGRAIADVLFGKYNPAGRLPITWYPADYVNKLPMTSMQLRPNPEMGYPGRTYKFYNGTTVFPFGYGLSYTDFTYTIVSAPKSVLFEMAKFQQCKPIESSNESPRNCPALLVEDSKCEEIVEIIVEVKNVGARDGSHVVLLYSVPPTGIGGSMPIKRVVGFERVFIKKRESVRVVFELNGCKSFSIIGEDAYELLPAGEHSIVTGDGDRVVSSKISVKFTTK